VVLVGISPGKRRGFAYNQSFLTMWLGCPPFDLIEGLCQMQVTVQLDDLLYIRPHTSFSGRRIIVEIDNSPGWKFHALFPLAWLIRKRASKLGEGGDNAGYI
jgi:hypothetical protein